MYIFNTTYQIPDNQLEKWLLWAKHEHLPYMLSSKLLTLPQIAKVITAQHEEGSSYSIQFKVNDLESLELWHKKYAKEFQQQFASTFNSNVIFFASILEIID